MRKTEYRFLLLYLFVGLFCQWPGTIFGQHLSINSWDIESGLSQNTVYTICQDDYGFIWIGTGKGLNRFDGKEFRQYMFSDEYQYAVGDNDINTLLADGEKLWVGMQTGLLVYNIRTSSFKWAKITDGKLLRNVNCLFQDHNKEIWVGSSSGLYRLTDSTNLCFTKLEIPVPATKSQVRLVRSIYEDSHRQLWIASNQGLIRIDPAKPTPEIQIYRYQPDDPGSLSSNIITAVTTDRNGLLWVGTQSRGINRFNPVTGQVDRFHSGSANLPLVNNNIRKLVTDSAGHIWVGTQQGLSEIDPQAMTIRHFQHDPLNKNSLSQNSVHSIFIDHNNLIWVGTFFGGVNLIHPYPSDFKIWENEGSSSGLNNNVVSSVARDRDGKLWIGTEGGGLNCYDPQTGKFRYYTEDNSAIGSSLIKTVFRDADDHIWIGTHAGGLNLYENGQFTKYFYHPESSAFLVSEISAIAEDRNRQLWLGFQGGIQDIRVYQRTGTTLLERSAVYDLRQAKGRNIKKILPDTKNNIWIATSKGLFIIPDGSRKAYEVKVAAGTLPEQITSLQEDSKGNIWFGVEHGGLYKYDPHTRKIYSHRFNTTGRQNDVYGLLEDRNGLLWVSTGSGLIKLDPQTGHYQSYSKADGLPANAFNYNAYYKDDQGIFYFGSFQGLVSFDPGSFFTNKIKSAVVFTSLKTLNQSKGIPIKSAEKLQLNYKQNVFTIEFALLNFVKPEKNRYAYKLEGFDNRWNLTEKPAATYMNLKPGHYTLVVKGANNDGFWSEEQRLSLVVLPPFWKTWWAYLIYTLLTLTIGFFILRYFYLRALIKKEDALHQHKLDFFTNVTHEIRTHLTLIMAPVDKMIHDRPQDGYLQQQFQSIKRNADDLLQLSEELMDFRKVETQHLQLQIDAHDIVAFIKNIYEHYTELSLARNIRISFTHDFASCQLHFDKVQLEKVFFNLISNAFKFTPDGGSIQVHIADEHPYVKVSVTDNGRGIAPEFKDKLFNNFFQVNDAGSQNKGYGIGLALSSKIAALHGARIEVDSTMVNEATQERRTIFAVFLQKGAAHFEQGYKITPKVVVNAPGNEPAVTVAEEPVAETDVLESYLREKKLSVLVVDDNPAIRDAIQEMLADKYEVTIREDAARGWAYAEQQIPDLVISDIMMPGEDGLSFCNRLKSDLRTCHIPVMLLTAKTTQEDQIAGLGRGADIYLTKPFNRKILELHVRNLLATRERVRETVAGYLSQGLPAEPATATPPALHPMDDEFLKNIVQLIEEHMDDPAFNVTVLAQKIGMSIPVLYKKMKAVADMSVNEFIKTLRLRKAAELLQTGRMAVYEVCYAVGFQDRKHFSSEFKKKYGKTPKQYALSE